MTDIANELIDIGIDIHQDGAISSEWGGSEKGATLFHHLQKSTEECSEIKQSESISVRPTNADLVSDMKNVLKTVFMVKSKTVATPTDHGKSDTMEGKDTSIREYGQLCNNLALSSVFVLDNVLVPLLHQNGTSSVEQETTNLRSSLHHTCAKKFVSRVCRFNEQEERGISLPIPPEFDNINTTAVIGNATLMGILEETIDMWYSIIDECIENELKQEHHSKGPIGEVDFWRRRHVILSAILQQISTPKGQALLEAMKSLHSASHLKVTGKIQVLTKLGIEAAENAKFLSTLERHLRILSDSSLPAVIQTIPSLMDSMRMVWTVSRHYNRDERMVPLMERVASQIITRVKHQINLHDIMNQEMICSQQTVSDCKKLLQSWRVSYMESRARIEEVGAGQRRWEFERGRLFDETDYMSEICCDLLEVLVIMNEFQCFLGTELASVTGETGIVNAVVAKIQSLPNFFRNFYSDPFDRKNQKAWKNEMERYNEVVVKIEESVGMAIECAFQQLRSSEMAFHLVMKFKGLKSRPSIHRILDERFQDILEHYAKELEHICNFFARNKDNPPVVFGHQRIPGRIAWANDLFHRAKAPIVLFQNDNGPFEDEIGLAIKRDYITFARTIETYKDELFNEWSSLLRNETYEGLRRTLLRRTRCAKVNSLKRNTNGERPYPLLTNFSIALTNSISEAKHFHRMGYNVPEAAFHLMLQENIFNSYVVGLNKMVDNYNKALDSLTDLELDILKNHIATMDSALSPGLTSINWSSQRISTFIDVGNTCIERFLSTVNQERKHLSSIERIVKRIESEAFLIRKEDLQDKEPSILFGSFINSFEVSTKQKLSKLVGDLKSMSQLIMKVVLAVTDTKKNVSPLFNSFSSYWTSRAYNALVEMNIRSFLGLYCSMSSFHPFSQHCSSHITIRDKEVVLDPSLSDLYKAFNRCVRAIMESTKHFKEWNEDLHVKRQNSIAVMEICSNHVMTNLLLSVKQEMLFLFKNMQSYLENWRKLYSDKGLINPKLKFDLKSSVLDYPSSYYEELYHSQQNRLESFQSMDHSLPSTALGIFKRVDCKAVLKDLNEQSNGILGDISDRMHSVARRKLEAIKANLELLRGSLNGEPESINELKGVLSVINTINSSNMDMNLACRDVQERYEVLKIYKVLVPEHEITLSLSLVSHWQNLVIFARTVDLRLADVKIDLQDDVRAKILDFKNEINRENTRFYASGPASSSISLEGGYELMKEWNIILDGMIATKKDIEGAERLLNIRNTRYDGINKIAESMKELNDIYKVYEKLVELKSTQADCSWIKVDLNVLIDGLSSVEDGFATLSSIKGNVEKNQLLKSSCKELKDLLPILKTLQHDFIQDRHTKELTKLNLHAPKEIEYRREKMTFSDLISLNLWKYPNQVENIIETATQEQKIEMVLREIQKCWASTTLMTKKFEDFFVLCSMDVTTQKLEDDLLQLQAMAGSKFAYFFEQEIEEMEGNLNAITECLDAWFRFQRKWMYLKSIFDGTDIRYQLPEQTAQFEIISRSFQGIMRSAIDSSNIVKSCCKEGRLELFQDLFESLEKCQKSLSQYLESKRISFPRFYFISDEELINILGDADISGIEPYLLKLFDNVKKVKFSGGNIVAIESSEKESFTLDNHIPTDSPVEVWMTRFEEEMKHCLWKATKETIFTYSHRDQTRWLLDNTNIGMCINCASQIWWTWEVEDAFLQLENGRKQSMRDLETKISRKLQEMVQMIRYPLHPLLRQKINSTLIINVHARDVVKALVLESVTSTNQFDWQSQLRFYWDRCEDDIMIKQCLGSFQYGFEYIGLNGRLVITPLTNRCFMTLTQALTFRLGGSPTGPAGTGKTETVKDLAKQFALPCFVINCGKGLDYKSIFSLFSGLVQTGGWGCFDEFNRLHIEVLSVVSSYLKIIQDSLINNTAIIELGIGPELHVKRVKEFATCGFFITMNPDYTGRTNLPEDLKALFRPVVMATPDICKIAENILLSEGFLNSKNLANKIVTLYQCARDQLTKQHHYDFGLRSMKAVLIIAGQIKCCDNDTDEELILMRALRDANTPKLVHEDIPPFLELIQDLFIDYTLSHYGSEKESLRREVEQYVTTKGDRRSDKESVKNQIDKVLQLAETQKVRHSTMIVGPTCSGKSQILSVLAKARHNLDDTLIKTFVINPKAQGLNEFYGKMDVTTRDWYDGIFSYTFRLVNQPLTAGRLNEERWIILDGDVDEGWVENLNSVMDDNRLLTLPNGERIQLESHVALIYEVSDLQYASPATVSRCGMVWVDQKDLGYDLFYERYVHMRFKGGVGTHDSLMTCAEFFFDLFHIYAKPCVDHVLHGKSPETTEKRLVQVLPVSAMEMCIQLCTLLDSMLPNDVTEMGFEVIENIYIYCVLWSFGAQLDTKSRYRFDAFIKKISRRMLPATSLYDFFYSVKENAWQSWVNRVKPFEEPQELKYHQIYVPTTVSAMIHALLEQLPDFRPLLFIGETGTGKTTEIKQFLKSLSPDVYLCLNIAMSSRTKSKDLICQLESCSEKRLGNSYGAPNGKKLMVMVDDVHLPKVDSYGTREPLALLLTLLDHKVMYKVDKCVHEKKMEDICMVAAMKPIQGGKKELDSRLISRFSTVYVPRLSESTLESIFGNILRSRLRQFGDSNCILEKGLELTKITISFFSSILRTKLPSPSKFHYLFSIRDLARVYEGLCDFSPCESNPETSLIRMWRNEMHRVFFDRLTTSDFIITEQEFSDDIKCTFKDCSARVLEDPMLFAEGGMWSIPSVNKKCYRDIGSNYNRLKSDISDYLKSGNSKTAVMLSSLVLFDTALDHLIRLLRVLRHPQGHALLIGVCGSGKKSITHLATYIAGYDLIEFKLKSFTEEIIIEKLKSLYKKASLDAVVLVLSDADVVDEKVLDYISIMLSKGIPNGLFEGDEKEKICKEHGDWDTFAETCENNLHIVLALSPSGESLRQRCRDFPSLLLCCTIDLFSSWPSEALDLVATKKMESELDTSYKSDITKISSHMVFVHNLIEEHAKYFCDQLGRHYLITPKHFMNYICTFHMRLRMEEKKLTTQEKRLKAGLNKLEDAAKRISEMTVALTRKKEIADTKTEALESLIQSIQLKTAAATKSRDEQQIKQASARDQAKLIEKEKVNADSALMEALPAVEAAADALNRIRREDLQELKAFNNPPIHVKIVCQMCTVLRPTHDFLEETWTDAKKLLGHPKLLESLKAYPKDQMTDKMYQRCKKILHDNKVHNITIETMATKSQAGKGLLVWVFAILRYYEVAKNVAPLRSKVKRMQKEQTKTEAELKELEQSLNKSDIEVKNLRVSYNEASIELSELQLQASEMEKHLLASSHLVKNLDQESRRWREEMDRLQMYRSQLLGNNLIGAAYLSYFGAFDNDFRFRLQEQLLNHLTKLNLANNSYFQLKELVLSKTELQCWNANGLPADKHSIENGILTMHSSTYPLCIDPQGQVVTWIKKTFEHSHLCVHSLSDKDYMKHLQIAVEYGHPFLFENVSGDIDSNLDNILDFPMSKNQESIMIGEKIVNWNPNFRLFFCTRLANPSFSPGMVEKIHLINCCISPEGLTEQLLNMVVSHEKPALEETFNNLIVMMTSHASVLLSLEDSLLKELCSSSGNILDNDDLIRNLSDIQEHASEIKRKMNSSSMKLVELEATRKMYQPVASQGSVFYFASTGLVTISDMYEMALDTFIGQFQVALQATKPCKQVADRLLALIQSCSNSLYQFTTVGIFEQHRLAYSFHLACMMMEKSNDLDKAAFDFFLRGDVSLNDHHCEMRPSSLHWMKERGWKELCLMATSSQSFKIIKDNLLQDSVAFRSWHSTETPELSMLKYCSNLTPLEKLCLIRMMRPDRAFHAAKLFVSEKLGSIFKPSIVDFKNIYKQSTCRTPIILILSPGMDPRSDIERIGNQFGFCSPHRLHFVPLGQGQGPYALEVLDMAYMRGHWVMIQNCHLLTSWLIRLNKRLDKMKDPHKSFRLWLTTELTTGFPLELLQRSFKVVIESPTGIKNFMKSNISKLDHSQLGECKHPNIKILLHKLAFLHSIFQERLKYGKLGWNANYGFNENDFLVGCKLVSLYLTDSFESGMVTTPWITLKYLIGDIIYGGRVSDSMDRRVLFTYLDDFLGDFTINLGFCKDNAENLLPGAGNFDQHVDIFDPILSGTPADIGLSSNAGILYSQERTNVLWTTLLTLRKNNPERSNNERLTEDSQTMTATTISNILDQIPPEDSFKLDKIREQFIGQNENEKITPYQIFLLQELHGWNTLCKEIYYSLDMLKKGLDGNSDFTRQSEENLDSLHFGHVPKSWRSLSPSSFDTLSSWLSHLKKRHDQYCKLVEKSHQKTIWLSGLHFPKKFLAAFIQTSCRMKKYPLDECAIQTRMTTFREEKEVKFEKLDQGDLLVHGLYLEGAGWDLGKCQLRCQDPNMLQTALPLLRLTTIEKVKMSSERKSYRSPIYVTHDRRSRNGEGLVLEAELRTVIHPTFWVLQGVAILLNAKD